MNDRIRCGVSQLTPNYFTTDKSTIRSAGFRQKAAAAASSAVLAPPAATTPQKPPNATRRWHPCPGPHHSFAVTRRSRDKHTCICHNVWPGLPLVSWFRSSRDQTSRRSGESRDPPQPWIPIGRVRRIPYRSTHTTRSRTCSGFACSFASTQRASSISRIASLPSRISSRQTRCRRPRTSCRNGISSHSQCFGPFPTFSLFRRNCSIFLLFLLPWLDTSPVRSARFRPIYKWVFWLLVVDSVVLGWVGSNPPEGKFILIGRLATLYYFVHFFAVLPLLGKFERPLPLPNSISEAALQEAQRRVVLVNGGS